MPFAIEGPGIARQGNPVAGGGVVTSGTFSPCLERGHRDGVRAGGARRARDPPEIDVRGTIAHAVVAQKPLYRKDPVSMAQPATYR